MKTLLRAVATAVLVVAASVAQAQGERFVLISHAPDSDSWWNTIKNAIELAGDQMDVEVEYRNPPTGDLADMARIVEQAAASNPDGIIVTIADFDVLEGPVTNAVDKGIRSSPSTPARTSNRRRSAPCCTSGSPNTTPGSAPGNAARSRA